MAAAISVKAPINGAVLRWARESIGAAPERAAKRANVSVDNYKKWELGEAPINKRGLHYFPLWLPIITGS